MQWFVVSVTSVWDYWKDKIFLERLPPTAQHRLKACLRKQNDVNDVSLSGMLCFFPEFVAIMLSNSYTRSDNVYNIHNIPRQVHDNKQAGMSYMWNT